ALGEFLNGLFQIILSNINGRPAKLGDELKILFTHVGHKNEPVKALNVPQVLQEEQPRRPRPEDQDIADEFTPLALLLQAAKRIARRRAVDPVTGMRDACDRLGEGPLLEARSLPQP